ncbi:MAG: hypothetical protein IKO90_10445 [Bacteroidales bacterium]|nr:hypothetical protein [Bacteroidales bacterium]
MRNFCFYQYFVPNGTFVLGKRFDSFGGEITRFLASLCSATMTMICRDVARRVHDM